MVRDRRAITFGTLLSARSIGTDTCCSISSAAWPGYSVMATTCVSEMSGYASMLSCVKAQSPRPTRPRPRTTAKKRWFSARRSSLAITASIAPRQAFEQHDAVDGDDLAGLHSAQHAHHAACALAERHRALVETPGLCFDEDHAVALVLDDRARGNHDGFRGRFDVMDAAVHLGPQTAVAVVHLRLHFHGAHLRVDCVRDARHVAGENFVGVRDEADLHLLADLNEADVALRHLRGHPHGGEIGDGHHARARIGAILAGHDAELEYLAGQRRSHRHLLLKIAGREAEHREAPQCLLSRC